MSPVGESCLCKELTVKYHNNTGDVCGPARRRVAGGLALSKATSVARGAAVAAAVAAGPADTITGDDALAAAEHATGVSRHVPHDAVAGELDEIHNVAREALLEIYDDGAAIHLQHIRSLVLEVARGRCYTPARRVQTCLRVHAAVQKIAEHLDVACAGMER